MGAKTPRFISQYRLAGKFSGRRRQANPVSLGNSHYGIELLEPRQLLSFTAPVSYTIGTTNDGFVPNAAPVNVVTADFNGDGELDLAVAHTSDNSIYISLGNRNGTFQTPVKTAVGEAIQGGLRVGDLNNDGKLDLFLPSMASGYPAVVMLGNGDGSFEPAINSSSFSVAGTYPRGWALADFNNDGKLDVVASLPGNNNTGGYTILLGNGDGTFKAGVATTAVLGYSRWVTTGDFNRDGKIDLAFADGQQTYGSAGNAELSIALGNGDGTFKAPVHYASPGLPTSDTLNPEDVVVGDVNGDGKLDAIVSNYDDNINVFLGNGDGTFQPAVGFSPGQYPRDVVIRDVNGDGKADLVVNNLGIGVGGAEFAKEGYQPGSVAVMLGNGDGTFQAPVQYQPFDYPGWTAIGDFNGDGSPDLAISQVFDGHSFAVMLNNPSSSNLPPTLAAGPTATPVTGKTAMLSALGADDGGESNHKYTWATTVSPPGSVVFSANGMNAAKNTTVTFTKPGTYYFKVTITDASGLSAIGMVPVIVNATPSSITVAPGTTSVAAGGTQQFSATGKDQFGNALSSQPAVTWAVNGGGSIGSTGLFTAGPSGGGPFTVTAVSSGISGWATVSVIGNVNGPTVASAAIATPSPVIGTTTNLNVLGADKTGEATLTYTWATTGTPPAPVVFSSNGTNAAKNVTAAFSKAGTYNFQVTVTDPASLTTSSSVSVTVNQTLTSIILSPASTTVATNQTAQFTATGFDQFGAQLSSEPAFAWSVSGGGTISSIGLFTAGATAGGPFTVTASSGNVTRTASITVVTPGVFTWTGNGATNNWSDPANWNSNAVPGSTATVVFNATSGKNAIVDSAFAGAVAGVQINSGYTGTVTMSRNLTVAGSFTESAGTFSEGTSTLFVAGNLAKNGGTFDAGTGAVNINGTAANQNLSATGVNFCNFTLANSAHSLNVTGTLTVNGTFTWLRTAGWILGPNGSGNAAIECRGDIDDQNHGGTGSPYFTLDGTVNQTIKDTSGVLNYNGFSGGDFRGLTINKASGTVILACDPVIYNGLSLVKGTVTSGSNWWFVGNESISTAAGLNLGNLTLSTNIAAGALSTGLQIASLNLNGHTLVAPSALYVSANLYVGGSGSVFNASSGTVIFDGSGAQQQLTSGGNTFYNLSILSGAVVQQEDDLTISSTFSNNGSLDRNGHKLNGQ